MKKFYKTVTTSLSNGGYLVLLDGKKILTPMKLDCLVPNEKLANHIMQEWASQQETIWPDSMPATQMMMTVIDRVKPNRATFEEEILGYLDTDMICYYAEEPKVYAEQQRKKWTAFLDWNKSRFGIEILTTTGLSSLAQPAQTKKTLKTHIQGMDDLTFGTLYLITTATGSLLMSLAFLEDAFNPQEVFEASLAEDLLKDEIYLADQYGISPDQERKRKILKSELENAHLFLSLLK
ncbi:MAG: ATP12 family protein [Pseudobdellovibrionaceae bacterium]|jgi:chaperone required for assembly of F1-ATPase|nr:ATP12 family protein [Pseudobdellovibrionaceae bacterium]